MLDIEIQQYGNQLFKTAQQLQTLHSKDILYGSYSIEQLQDKCSKIQQSLNTLNAYCDDYSSQYTTNQGKIQILQQAEQKTIDSLIQENTQLLNSMVNIEQRCMVDYINNPTIALESFQNIKSLLTEICTTISVNADKRFNSEALKLSRQKLSETQIQKQNIIQLISNKQAKLKHLLDHKDSSIISCVKCHHKFSLVYSEESCEALTSDIDKANLKLDIVNKELKSIEDFISECLEYSALYRQYIQITSSHPHLSKYWDYLQENNIITNDPRSAVHIFNKIEQDLNLHIEYHSIQNKKLSNEELLNSLKQVGTESLQSLLETNKRLYTSIGSLTNKISSKSLKYDLLNSIIQKKKSIETLLKNIESLQTHRELLTKDYIETMRRSSLNAFIKQIQSELGAKEHILHLASNQKSVIKNIEDQITELETDKEALTHLINSLSPTDGLIAQGLLGFIRSYVDEMNEFIEKVWAYSMTIQACDVQDSESLDLDYKFPINIDDPDDPVPDVSKCSKGMKEIINLAFKITAMKNLDLLDTPLYLDEFGSAMDTGHKNEIISLIKSFNEQKTFSQMFIVSHDVTQYSSISNAQVCVVCETNIITPESFNEHVKIH
jgi:hypothetical protein